MAKSSFGIASLRKKSRARKLCSKLKCRTILLASFFAPAILTYFLLIRLSPLFRPTPFLFLSSHKGVDENFLSQLEGWLVGQQTNGKEDHSTPLSSISSTNSSTPFNRTSTPEILAPPIIGNKSKTWSHWPAVAYEEIDHALVYKGDTFISRMRESLLGPSSALDNTNTKDKTHTLLEEFLEVYGNRPDKVNKCGILINHALALFFAVKQLNPTLVVESGVNAGQSTYFIRKASPDTKIWAIDPLEVPICDQGVRWVDPTEKTTYFVGDKFIDLNQFDWKQLSTNGTIDIDSTLFFIDDHKEALSRIRKLSKAGAKHVMIEDNYKVGEGASFQDKRGYTPKQIFLHPERKIDAKWLFENMKTYAEFPPLVPPIMAKKAPFQRKPAGGFMVWQDKNEDIVAPILRPDLLDDDNKTFYDVAAKLELNPDMKDFYSYKQFMNYNQICYLELM